LDSPPPLPVAGAQSVLEEAKEEEEDEGMEDGHRGG
jgi:hypothetical protein